MSEGDKRKFVAIATEPTVAEKIDAEGEVLAWERGVSYTNFASKIRATLPPVRGTKVIPQSVPDTHKAGSFSGHELLSKNQNAKLGELCKLLRVSEMSVLHKKSKASE